MLLPGPSWFMSQPRQGALCDSWQAMRRRVGALAWAAGAPGSAMVLFRARCFSGEYPLGISRGSVEVFHGHLAHWVVRGRSMGPVGEVGQSAEGFWIR